MQHYNLGQSSTAQFPESMTDVRGYEVRTRDTDEKIGKVDGLVCSPDGQIRYLDVDLAGLFNTRHVALPVGAAQVDRTNDVVWVTGLSKDQIKDLPDYTGDASSITDDYEQGIRRSVTGGAAMGAGAASNHAASNRAASNRAADTDLYDQGRFYAERGGEAARNARLVLSEEQLSIGKRQVQAGEVALHKTVETEHVTETVPLMREEVTIERHPIAAGSTTDANIQIGEDEIRIPVMEEQAVVEKRTVATEEVVVNKRTVTENETVEADLRRERVDIDDSTTTQRAGATTGRTSGSKSGAADRATNSGPLDRLADKADNLKDRVDGNPASRPGPDATDRNI
jgi:uncharacterized protein (TIGR02271 family)